MSYIYKPVMLQTVLRQGGIATRDEIAAEIMSRDLLQLEHYRKKIVHPMPGKRLVRDGILEFDGDAYRLAPPFDTLTRSEQLELMAACEHRIEAHLEIYGDQFGNNIDDPVSGSLRYEVLKRSGGRCKLCGVSHEEVRLDVDHIVPRSKGGSNDESNLQVLCRTCNSQKTTRTTPTFVTSMPNMNCANQAVRFAKQTAGSSKKMNWRLLLRMGTPSPTGTPL